MNLRYLLGSLVAVALLATSALAVNQPESSPSDTVPPPVKAIPQAPQAQAPLMPAKTVYQTAPVYQAPVCTNCGKHRGWRRR